MNQSSSGFLLSKAIEGFLSFKLAYSASMGTITGYKHDLGKFLGHAGDRHTSQITTEVIREFMGWLRTGYAPRRFNGETHPISAKTLRNFWVCLSGLFGWLAREFGAANPMTNVPAPKTKRSPVETFTRDEVDALLKAAEWAREAKTVLRREYRMRRGTYKRDISILLCLLDAGMRASELCHLDVRDVDLKEGKVEIKHGTRGGAKGGKGRFVYLGKTARRALWRYLATREDQGNDPGAPLFIGKFERRITPGSLLVLIKRLGARANVSKCHPHRFRHTFAISYLRGGGDVFTLQSLLGHSDLAMVQHYARVAEVDIQEVHKRASPADNWRL